MKKNIVISISLLTLASLSVGLSISFMNRGDVKEAKASPTYSSSMPTTIYLKDNTDTEIRSYYNQLTTLTDAERSGTNLLKSLRDIIHDDITYYAYGSIGSSGVTQIYTITDRDWENSPISSIASGSYNEDTKTITGYSHSTEKNNDPYIKMLYVDYELNGPTRMLNGTAASFDKEHVWSQSHGFKASSGATGPAGTDLHHLIAGEKTVNQQYHSNYSYGMVDVAEKEATETTKGTVEGNTFYIRGNKLGTSKKTSSSDEENKVFEPNDADKGRIARALLYMAACYNNISGTETITQFDPDLELVDYIIEGGKSEISSDTGHSAKYGILSDLLDWNRKYKPDAFEIHRNNIIYNTYQHNRNPFIDFPEWADYIWGNEESGYVSTGKADPTKDTINDFSDGGTVDPGDEDELTASVNIATHATNNSWSNNTKYPTINADEHITLTAAGGSNAGNYISSDDTWRIYQTGSDTITISADEGYVLDSVTFTYSVSNTGVLLDSSDNVVASDDEVALSGTSATFHVGNSGDATNGQVRFTNIVVKYHAESVIPPTPVATSIEATVSKTYKVGERISKSDITVIDDLDNVITDFTFNDDNYQFKYEDAYSGGSTSVKSFDIAYGDLETTLDVKVQRDSYVAPNDTTKSLIAGNDASTGDFVDITATSYKDASDFVVTKDDISYLGTSVYKYWGKLSFATTKNSDTNKYYSNSTFGNTTKMPTIIKLVTVTTSESGPDSCRIIEYSPNGVNDWSTSPDNNSYYFRIRYEGEFTGYINITRIDIDLAGAETAVNVSNYIMYEDTNNQCESKLDIAIGYFNNMTVSERNIFMTSTDYVIGTARERFEAWLTNQSKSIEYVNGDYNVLPLRQTNKVNATNNIAVLAIMISTSISLIAISIFMIKRKKHR